ncbi:MAG: ribosomal protein L35 [Planctomycetota bacterium]|jgi:ribosomal protein L35
MAEQRPNTYRRKTHSSQAKRWRPNAPTPIEGKPTQAKQSDGGPTPQRLSKENPLKPSKAMAAQRPNTYRSKTHSSQAKRWRPNAPIPIEAKPTQAKQSDGGTTPQYLSKQNPLKPSKAMAAQRPNTYRSKTHSSRAKRWRNNAPIPIEAALPNSTRTFSSRAIFTSARR